MPKVETSPLKKRDETTQRRSNQSTNVSKLFGKITPPIDRYKRETSLPNRRIIKKLVRIEPIYKDSDTYELDGKKRKRVVVRKKKRKLLTTTSRPRRRLVVKKKLLPKTVVTSLVEYDTSTVVQTRQRTYTFVVTRVNGNERFVTSTTEIKPQTDTITKTEARTILTTLTLSDFSSQHMTVLDSTTLETNFEEEPRYNLATRVMSNGVEVIVAGDKTTLPGEPDIKRILPTTIYKPITLKPSTLSDHMMMVVPQESSNIAILPSLYSNQFVTKTCLTTFTYLTTYLENGTTAISSREQVVSNVATEERNSQMSSSTPFMGVTLTQPILEAGTFHTTYTYLNTILDGEQPIVITSRHTVTNTVTAPSDYLSHLKRPQEASIFKDTNTYYSTAHLQKTLFEGDRYHVTSTKEIITQVVITESVPSPIGNAMTLDDDAGTFLTTDVVKTYYVTYTYYNSLIENGEPTVKLNVSTSTDVVTEKLVLQPKRTNTHTSKDRKKTKVDLQILATKTYVTTYTSFTTLLQVDSRKVTSTIVSSNTRQVENVITETIDPTLIDSIYISSLKSDIKKGTETVVKHATLLNGDQLQITAINKKKISPTKVLPIEKTQMVTSPLTPVIESTNPNVITGSTIIFFDDELVDTTRPTPTLSSTRLTKSTIKNNLGQLLSTEIVKKKTTTQTKRHVSTSLPSPTKPKNRPTEPPKKKTNSKIAKPTEIPDLLGLGSINTFQVLTPVINAMAGLIKTNIKQSPKNGTATNTPPPAPTDAKNRSPIYIPIGDQVADVEIAESQNLATIHINEWENDGKPPPQSPLMNGGIPISPGQVITANSDVIVGKPGRIGPRIPSIPLREPQGDVFKEEYMRRPPLARQEIPLRPQNFIRGEAHKILKHKLPSRQGSHVQFKAPPVIEFSNPLLLPEVVERSKDQPLLVNLQPSQVAFINIPFNRTTALLYGGSTEVHKNGKYFDDPAPHLVPEFSVLKKLSTQRAPTFVNSNQQQVVGYIKVGEEAINNNPIAPPSSGQSQIVPSRPIKDNTVSVAPPIIKHDDVIFQPPPPPASYHIRKDTYPPFKQIVHQKLGVANSSSALGQENEGTVYFGNPQPPFFQKLPPQQTANPIKDHGFYSRTPNANELKEYLTPPKAPFHRKQIPIRYVGHRPMHSHVEDLDDLATEDGEVIQESIARPLRPGQLPDEVLEKLYKNLSAPNSHNVNFGIRVVGKDYVQKPFLQVPRPFGQAEVHVRPENQLTNQIDVVDYERETTTTSRPTSVTNKKKPYVTSMPVNVQSTTSNINTVSNFQTEKPFSFSTERNVKNVTRPSLSLTTLSSISIKEMEIMKPPPPPPPKPHQSIRPPKIDIKPTNVAIQRPKPIADLEAPIRLDDRVVGLRPPPLSHISTSEKVLGLKPNVTTQRPLFSLEINPPRPVHPYTFEIPQITTTRRQAITRRPTTKKTTPTTRFTQPTTMTTKIKTSTEEAKANVTLKTEVTQTTVNPTTTPSIVEKPTSPIVPSKYVTHTETTTVTITRTTVTETLGGPPSTMTILVTTTEKLTKIDTITEIHTLLKPTSIVETVTTTINQTPILPSIQPTIRPTPTVEITTPSTAKTTEDNLEDFIIRDTDPPPVKSENHTTVDDNDSILVVLTDKKNGQILAVPEQETDLRDEIPNGNVNQILLGGILIDSPPILDTQEYKDRDRCHPECKAGKNELCQKTNGLMRCVCRPGFARMFLDHPCKPTYTYSVKLVLDGNGQEKLRFNDSLNEKNSTEFNRLARLTYEGLDRMVMQSDLRDIYHGVQVHAYEPFPGNDGLINEFHLQLSENTEQRLLGEIFKKYLASNNYSLGGTDLRASKSYLDGLQVEDFDECQYTKYHDCSDHAHCFNMPGTYTCSCKEGFSDLSENPVYPGRICSAELIGCERCHYHGTCYARGEEQVLCECFQWYTGEYCHINLKVLLIALGTLGALLLILLFICIILTCCRRKSRHSTRAGNLGFMPQRLAVPVARRGTMDRRLMIRDTSSESSQSDIHIPTFVDKKPKQPKKVTIKKSKENAAASTDQDSRSLPVVIPRAKYHPVPPACVSMVPLEKRKTSAASSNEMKLLSYLDVGPNPNKIDPRRKPSNTRSESYLDDGKLSGGALVSAGFEVSATVGCGTMGTIATTCGTEADRSENATLIQKISAADLLSCADSQSQFATFRKSLLDDQEDSLSNWLDLAPKLTATVSQARSYDETTIHVPTKSYRHEYDRKPSSQNNNDEANTMAERDVGSTFLLPHTHLYKRDRGSDDVSGFDSL